MARVRRPPAPQHWLWQRFRGRVAGCHTHLPCYDSGYTDRWAVDGWVSAALLCHLPVIVVKVFLIVTLYIV